MGRPGAATWGYEVVELGISVAVAFVMLRVGYEQWGQRPDDLRALAVSSSHERTRERFLALYEMSSGTRARIGRHPQSVMQWVHAYNSSGPGAVVYRRTGGRPPFAGRSRPHSAA